MSPADWQRVETLFHGVLELPERERSAFLDRVCPESDPLRNEVDSLLVEEASVRETLAAPPARLAADVLDRQPGTFTPGQRTGDYEIQRLVIKGGMGEVYLAQHVGTGRPIGLKILRRHLAAAEQAVYRFHTEARAISELCHPNIVAIHEFGESPDGLFIAMEWVEGITWRHLMKNGAAGVSDVAGWGSQAAAALAVAHHSGVLHRDIKPENIMLRKDGVVKVLDFGLARLTKPDHPAPAFAAASVRGSSGTISGTLSGTLLYMPPEILRGEAAGPGSDVFSLGAVLYELAAGVHPFAGETPLDVFEAIECRKLCAPSAIRPAIPPDLDAIILAMLERGVSERPSAAEVLGRLRK
jgi:serine/threonine protein kinase